MKLLSGSELASYIKERQAKQVRGLRQAWGIYPKLAIVMTGENPVIDTYVRLKSVYGQDILIDVVVHHVDMKGIDDEISQLNDDDTVHGIIVQLPLTDTSRTEEILELVAPHKDVDGLGSRSRFDPATPIAINWLLAGFNIDLQGKKIVIVGHGRLVGAPLATIWQRSGYDITVVEKPSDTLAAIIQAADVVVSATGSPGLITSDMLRPETTIVDAATSSEDGKIVGDIAPDVRKRHDLTITPEKGGVGPLTICALFDNVILSARSAATELDQERS